MGPAWQGGWVLVYCHEGPEHPEEQGEKGLTHPAPLPLPYFMEPEEQEDDAGSVPWRCLSWTAADSLVLMLTPRVPGGHPTAWSLPGFIWSNK